MLKRILSWLAMVSAVTVIASSASGQPQPVPAAGDWSVPNNFRADNTDRPGGDFLRFGIPANAAEGAPICARACAENGQCRSYTYVKPGVQEPLAQCYLKNIVPAARPDPCCISGARDAATVVAFPTIANPFPNAETAARVGFAKHPAVGVIPVAVVIVDFGPGFPVDDTNASAYDADFFEDLVFGPARSTTREFVTSRPVTLPSGRTVRGADRASVHSVASFYWEASNHRLVLAKAGPVIFPALPVRSGGTAFEEAAKLVAQQYGERLRLFDKNGDGKLTSNEFAILVFDNGTESGAAAREATLGQFCTRPAGSPVDLCMMIGANGYRSRVLNPAHEFMHVLGIGYDTYGWDPVGGGGACWGGGATIMSCTAFLATAADRNETVDFDAYYRMVFGWASPQLLRIGRFGVFKLKAAQSIEDRPLILHKPDWSEIYVIEYRDGTLGGHDAAFFKGDPVRKGVMFWYAKFDRSGLEQRPSGLGGGNDAMIQSARMLDDVAFDIDQPCRPPAMGRCPGLDGVTDVIRPGPNATLDSRIAEDPSSATRDGIGTTAMIMPTRDPTKVWTTGVGTDRPVAVGSSGITLRDWVGQQLPIRIEIQPHPTERDAVLVFVNPGS